MKSIFIALIILIIAACSNKIVPSGGNADKNVSQEVARGQKVFMSMCNRCHPSGRGGLGPSIIKKPGFLIKFQVRHGLGAMPSFDKNRISKEDLNKLVSYIRDIS